MHLCEIMIRDVAESRRLKKAIERHEPGTAPGTGSGTTPGDLGAAAAEVEVDGEEEQKHSGGEHVPMLDVVTPGSSAEGEGGGGGGGDGGGRGAAGEDKVVNAVVYSEHFWPPLVSEPMTLHAKPQQWLDDFNKSYSVLKAPRSLVWKNQLGLVDLDLEFDRGQVVRSFSVSPAHANLILFFDDEKPASAQPGSSSDGGPVRRSDAELVQLTGLPTAIVRKKMALWVSHGVVAAVNNPDGSIVYVAQDRPGEPVSGAAPPMLEPEESSLETKSVEKALEMYKKFICGMLQNLGAKSLEDIHNMLKMYTAASEDKYDKSPRELALILSRLIASEEVEKVDGLYHLRRK